MTIRDLAILSLFTEIMLVDPAEDMDILYEVAEEVAGRPVLTHELPDVMNKHKDKLSEMAHDVYIRVKNGQSIEINELEKKRMENIIRSSIKEAVDRNFEIMNYADKVGF